MNKESSKKSIQNNTNKKKRQKSISLKESFSNHGSSGPYRQKYAADFLFMPWPADKKFLDKLAEDYLNWALTLARKIRSGELDPSVSMQSLTVGEFFEEAGIPYETFQDWLKGKESVDLIKAHTMVKGILGRVRECLALYNKANAAYIMKTLGNYSNEYRAEREWLSSLSLSEDGEKSRSTIIVNIPEVRSESGNSDMAK